MAKVLNPPPIDLERREKMKAQGLDPDDHPVRHPQNAAVGNAVSAAALALMRAEDVLSGKKAKAVHAARVALPMLFHEWDRRSLSALDVRGILEVYPVVVKLASELERKPGRTLESDLLLIAERALDAAIGSLGLDAWGDFSPSPEATHEAAEAAEAAATQTETVR